MRVSVIWKRKKYLRAYLLPFKLLIFRNPISLNFEDQHFFITAGNSFDACREGRAGRWLVSNRKAGLEPDSSLLPSHPDSCLCSTIELKDIVRVIV